MNGILKVFFPGREFPERAYDGPVMAELFVPPVRVTCVVVAILCGASVRAQQPAAGPSGPTGSVAGYVEFDETKLPARFAVIHLVPKPDDAAMTLDPNVRDMSPAPRLHMAVGSSEMDGRFHIDGVPEGDYFAGALMPGYVATREMMGGGNATGERLKKQIASLPIVHVSAGQVANLNLTLHHAAVIAGRVQYADGSPAVFLQVGWEPVETNLAWPSMLQEIMQDFDSNEGHPHGVTTDDEGRYRIFGLPPGKYIVSTIIASQVGSGQIMSDGSGSLASGRQRFYPNMTTVYWLGVFRRGDARVFEVRGGEQVTDADVKIDVSGLHSIRGKVLAGEGRSVVRRGGVRLQEDGKDFAQRAMIEDGSFEIDYVPSGSYTLVVAGSPEETAPSNMTDVPKSLRSYKQAKVPVVVGGSDVVLDEVVLTALKPGEKMEN